MLRMITGLKRDEVRENWRRLHNDRKRSVLFNDIVSAVII
jgi:hypothetical protein